MNFRCLYTKIYYIKRTKISKLIIYFYKTRKVFSYSFVMESVQIQVQSYTNLMRILYYYYYYILSRNIIYYFIYMVVLRFRLFDGNDLCPKSLKAVLTIRSCSLLETYDFKFFFFSDTRKENRGF